MFQPIGATKYGVCPDAQSGRCGQSGLRSEKSAELGV